MKIENENVNERRINTRILIENWKKTMEHESHNYTSCDWCSWYSHQGIIKRNEWLRNYRTRGDHPNFYIIDIDPEFCKESWRLEETCCHPNFSEWPSCPYEKVWKLFVCTSYTTFPTTPVLLEPYHHSVYCHIQDTHWGRIASIDYVVNKIGQLI